MKNLPAMLFMVICGLGIFVGTGYFLFRVLSEVWIPLVAIAGVVLISGIAHSGRKGSR